MAAVGSSATLNTSAATALVQVHFDPHLRVVRTRALHGGMVNRVEEWRTDGQPPAIVAKLTETEHHEGFHAELESLRWFRQHTAFPVPQPYACFSATEHGVGTCLLMEKLRGRNLAEARLTPRGMAVFQTSLADVLADLHESRRSTYGSAVEPAGPARWLDIFRPRIEKEFSAVRDCLQPRSRQVVGKLLDHLNEWLPECHQPTLVHGDLWATNILLDDADPAQPVISGFVDGSARYTDVEYELAYLRVFHTADDHFFGRYVMRHPLRVGFERRCRVYWLHTMLLHVRHFGNDFLPRTERLASEIEALE